MNEETNAKTSAKADTDLQPLIPVAPDEVLSALLGSRGCASEHGSCDIRKQEAVLSSYLGMVVGDFEIECKLMPIGEELRFFVTCTTCIPKATELAFRALLAARSYDEEFPLFEAVAVRCRDGFPEVRTNIS